MLAKVEVEDEYIFDGVMTKVIYMDLGSVHLKCPTHANRHKLK